ncbi:hypothetical protein MCEMKE157_01243 [actinobacterium SCGC AAA044-D11]
MFNLRSKAAFWATIFAFAYGIYAIVYWAGTNSSSTDSAEAIGAGIATLLVLPHLLITWLGIIFGIIGFFTRKTGLQLTAAILYAVGAVLFILYALFLLPSIVLGFIGYSVQKKLNASGQSK